MSVIQAPAPGSVSMGDEDREAGAHCGVVVAIGLAVTVLIFAAGYIAGALAGAL